MKWKAMFGEGYDDNRSAISIKEVGVYFVYVKFDLICPDEKEPENFNKFIVELHSWNEGYNKSVPLIIASDGITCPSDSFRSVVVEELLELTDGDYVSVWIAEGYNLIKKSSYGAFYI